MITPLLGPLTDMLRSKKAIALVAALVVTGALCYLGKIAGADMLRFAEVVVSAYLVAEGASKIGSTTSADTPAQSVQKEGLLLENDPHLSAITTPTEGP